MEYHIKSYSKCQCGAISLSVYDENGEHLIDTYHCKAENLSKFFADIDLTDIPLIPEGETFSCDHCANHYGLDLCGCGSGEDFGECENDLPECSSPRQQLLGKSVYDPVDIFDAFSGTQPDDFAVTSLTELVDYEKSMRKRIQATKNEIYAKIRDHIASTPIKGVTEISQSPRVVTVNASQVKDVWSPEYYMADKQADLVSEALSSATTPEALLRRISEIIDTGYVTVKRTRYRINDTTVSILKSYV